MDERRYSSWLLERLAIGEIHRLRVGTSTIGRHSSSVIRILDSHYVSRNHARIEVSEDDQHVEIEDLKSVNGVFVNKVLYRESSARLQGGDHIGIGVVVDEDVSADPGHPVFVLKYAPLQCRSTTANKQRPCPLSVRSSRQGNAKLSAPTSPAIAIKLPISSKSPNGVETIDEKPSTSASAAFETIITISDDEDEVEDKSAQKTNSSSPPSLLDPKQTTSNSNSVGANFASPDNDGKNTKTKEVDICEAASKTLSKPIAKTTVSIDPIPGNKSEQNELKQSLERNQQEKSTDNVPSNDEKQRSNSRDISKSNSNEMEKNSADEDIKNVPQLEPLSTSTTTSPKSHMPIMSSIKQERVRTVSAEIQNIFGGTDEFIVDTVKGIDPFVYKTLNRTSSNQLRAGTTINLLNDDEEIGQLILEPISTKETTKANETTEETVKVKEEPQSENTSKRAASPNIFETSLNDSNEDANIKSKQPDTMPNSPVAQANDNPVYDLRSDDEEFMFSQVVINDMKEELADENFEDCMADLEEVIDEMKLTSEPLQLEQDKLVTIKKELDSSVWTIDHSDDEDFDEELETKVSDWSAKLFSQSLTQGNMSQIYDVDYDEDEDADNEEDKASEADDIDNDVDLNFYTGNTDKFIDELYQSLQQKCEPEETEAALDDGEKEEEEELAKKTHEERQDSIDFDEGARDKKRLLSSTDGEEDVVRAGEEQNEIEEPAGKEQEKADAASAKSKEESAAIIEEENSIKSENVISKDTTKSKITALASKAALPKDKKASESEEDKTSLDSKILKRRKSTVFENSDKDSKLESFEQRKRSTSSDKVVQDCKVPIDKVPVNESREVATKPSTSSLSKEKNELKDKTKIIRGPPTIIDAPQLPKHKGKLRGVSACQSTIGEKFNAVRERVRSEKDNKELKRKWLEKPSIMKKRDKEHAKHIKDSRKELLKELAQKQHKLPEATRKRKSKPDADGHEASKVKKPKVKITENNRGAFLTNETDIPAPQRPFKIPKVVRAESIIEKDLTKIATNIKTSSETAVPLSSPKINSATTLFEEILGKPDLLLTKPPKVSPTDACSTAAATSSSAHSSTNNADKLKLLQSTTGHGKASVAARAKRTTNKITFASMQRNFVESHQNQKKLELISNIRTCMTDTEKRNEPGVKNKPKKVRFNDTPIIHYIDRIFGATKKVDKKDILPLSTINNRRQIIRSAFPIIDCTSKIISMFLIWSNEWLEKRNVDAQGAEEIILPMSNQFTSFECYKNVLFPLMKLEFLCGLEREFKQCKLKPFKVALEYVTNMDDRLMLITKYNTRSKTPTDTPPRCDLVILDFNDKHNGTFAFVSTNRKGTGTCSTLVFEIISKNYTKAYLSCIKEINVRPVVDNIRIEFGAFNAVYQLESTPLFGKIINPLELLKCKPIPTRKIKYKGFNKLNPKQEQILLNTYAKMIDETTPNITLIKGPPGTGKSCLITNLALQSMYGEEVRCMDKKILICAQSNGAVDVITAKLYDVQQRMRPEIRFRVIRYGIPEKINPAVRAVSLQNIVQKDQQKQLVAQYGNITQENKENIKNDMLTLEAQIMEMQQRNIKGTVEEDELIEKNKQLQLMRSIINQTIRPEDERAIYTWHLTNANIVCTTLSSCVKLSQYVNYFDICIIDEATQCTEPWTLMPLKFGINSLVLVGDTQQLPATVLSKKAMDLGFCNSMFTRIQRCLENVNTTTLPAGTQSSIICSLQTQYRMHAEICRWPNLYFYKNELINAQCTLALKTPIAPFSVINLAYSQNEHCNDGKISNDQEAEFVIKLLKALDGYIPNKYNSYGVITPYVEHRKQLESSLKASGLTNIMVNTIDSYQGLEKDVIVISNARTRGIGFLSNYQRLNVALTRPRKCLILCGNFKNLESVPSWRSLLKNARERKVFYEISAESAQDIHRNVIEKIKVKQ